MQLPPGAANLPRAAEGLGVLQQGALFFAFAHTDYAGARAAVSPPRLRSLPQARPRGLPEPDMNVLFHPQITYDFDDFLKIPNCSRGRHNADPEGTAAFAKTAKK